MQNCGMPPICNFGRKFQRKNGQNLTNNLFILSSPNFRQENGLILSGENFFLVFIILKFPGDPPLKILRTLVVRTIEVE